MDKKQPNQKPNLNKIYEDDDSTDQVGILQNKAGLWISEEEWNFKTKGDLIYVENVSNQKVLEATSNDKVTLEDIEDGKTEQLWKKGEPNTEGYFILENCKVPKILTAISSSRNLLEIKGNITIKKMHS